MTTAEEMDQIKAIVITIIIILILRRRRRRRRKRHLKRQCQANVMNNI